MSIASSKPVVPVGDSPACEAEGDAAPEAQNLTPEAQNGVLPMQLDLQVTRRGQVDLETQREPLVHYLRNHPQWIQRCFRPLRVHPLSADSYKLEFFRMGGLGFELEPCLGVKIWPDEENVFRLTSIDLPGEGPLPYHVDCQATFRLEELTGSSPVITRVHWDLQLEIALALPRFLQVLPQKLVRRAAQQVVQQVTRSLSDRFTHTVCSDFYCWSNRPGHRYRWVAGD